jgi:transposase
LNSFCGIDWAEGHHDIAIVDGEGKLVAKKRISDDSAGFTVLTEMLAAAGDSFDDAIPIAIETPRGLLVAALRATGRPVFAINPLAVARYRERRSVAGAKSDHADAMTLANILRVDSHLHRRMPADSELAQAIAVLARAQQDAVWRRSKASNELRSMLREYYPAFLDTFAGKSATNLAKPEARAVLAIAPLRRTRPNSSRPASPPRCAAPAANAASTVSPSTFSSICKPRSCASPSSSRRRWAAKPLPCWRCSTPPAPAPTSLHRPPPKNFANTPTAP